MITSIYAVPLAALFLILTARVITYRRGNKIGLGDGGDKSLIKRMRAQGNFAEFVPFGLLLMLMVEMNGTQGLVLHLIGVLLLVGRFCHGYGFSTSPPKMQLRVGGMILTLASYIVSIITLALSGLNATLFAAI